METIEFEGANLRIAAGQKEYNTIPALLVGKTEEERLQGRVVFCWKLTWRERWKVLFGGVLWHSVLTCNQPFQPQRLEVDSPLEEVKADG